MEQTEHEEVLALVPAYNRGELSPAEAHRVAQFLSTDDDFSREAAREEIVAAALRDLKSPPLPKGLVARSIRKAVGKAAKTRWFSLDTILLAIGVGVIFGALSQLLLGRIGGIPEVSGLLLAVSQIAAEGRLPSLIIGIWVITMSALVAGVWYALRASRV